MLIQGLEPARVARLDAEVNSQQTAVAAASHDFRLDVVDAARDLPADPTGQPFPVERKQEPAQPVALVFGLRGEVVVLEQKEPDTPRIEQVSHLPGDVLRRPRPPQRAWRLSIKLPDAAKRAIEEATAAGQHRSRRNSPHRLQLLPPGRPGQPVEVFDQGTGRVDDYLAVAAESQALNFAPGFGTVQPLEQLARSQLAFEAHHRVEFRDGGWGNAPRR